MVTFTTIDANEPHNVLSSREIDQSNIMRCPFYILVPEHYREDDTCKCDDADHRQLMIREWGYSAKDFVNIPLRERNQNEAN